MIDSLILLAVLAAGLLLAFRGVTLRTCPAGPRPARGRLALGIALAVLGLAGLLLLHGPRHPETPGTPGGHGGAGSAGGVP